MPDKLAKKKIGQKKVRAQVCPAPEKAPFDVDPTDDGDIATPKPNLDEQDLMEQENRRQKD